MDPVLVPLWPEAGRALGLGRTKMFELAKSGDLETVHVGRKPLVPVDALHAFRDRLRAVAGATGGT